MAGVGLSDEKLEVSCHITGLAMPNYRTMKTIHTMFSSLPSVIAIAALVGASPIVLAEEKPQLSASLIVNKDPVGLAPEYKGKAFREKIEKLQKAGEPMPEAQAVDFTLRITNDSKEAAVLKVGGDESEMVLHLEGKGALNVDNMMMFTADYRFGKSVTLASGESMDLPVKSLASGKRGVAKAAFFTETGDHKLSATFTSMREGGPLSLKAAAVGFTVVDAK
jgi:hypothetical protein